MRGRLSHFVARADVADLVGAAAFVGLILALVFGVIVPVAVHDRLSIARHESAVRTRQRANALSASIRSATAEVDQVKARLAAAPDRLRPASALNERLAVLVALAGECNVTIQDLKPADAVRRPRNLAVPVRVSGRGGYPDVTRLLHRLHDQTPDFAVEGFGCPPAAPTRWTWNGWPHYRTRRRSRRRRHNPADRADKEKAHEADQVAKDLLRPARRRIERARRRSRLRRGERGRRSDSPVTAAVARTSEAALPKAETPATRSLATRLRSLMPEPTLPPAVPDAFAVPATWSASTVAAAVDGGGTAFRRKHTLKAVISSGQGGGVLLDDRLLTVGESVDGYELREVRQRHAVFAAGDAQVMLELPTPEGVMKR